METSSKERLTGALLVVLALVILIPELLSGHRAVVHGTPAAQNPEDGAPLQTFDVQLDGSKVATAVPRDVPAAAAAEIAAVPPPVTSTEAPPATAPASAVEVQPAAKPEKPEEKPVVDSRPPDSKPAQAAVESAKPQAPVPAPTLAPAGKWWVQLGVFASRDNAQQLARKLRAAGFTIDVSQSGSKGKELYRVRAGPEADRTAASALRERLVAAGQKPSLVAP